MPPCSPQLLRPPGLTPPLPCGHLPLLHPFLARSPVPPCRPPTPNPTLSPPQPPHPLTTTTHPTSPTPGLAQPTAAGCPWACTATAATAPPRASSTPSPSPARTASGASCRQAGARPHLSMWLHALAGAGEGVSRAVRRQCRAKGFPGGPCCQARLPQQTEHGSGRAPRACMQTSIALGATRTGRACRKWRAGNVSASILAIFWLRSRTRHRPPSPLQITHPHATHHPQSPHTGPAHRRCLCRQDEGHW